MKMTKREVILLVLLLIIAVTFIEIRYIITPTANNLLALSAKNNELSTQIDEINTNLQIAKALDEKMQKNLTAIDELSTPFYDSITQDILLLRTYKTISSHNLIVIKIEPQITELLPIEQISSPAVNLLYDLKKLSQDYRSLEAGQAIKSDSEKPQEDSTADPAELTQDVEYMSIKISMYGLYSDFLNLIADIKDDSHANIIKNIQIASSVLPNQVIINCQIDYYGIDKIVKDASEKDSWDREPITTNTSDPFYYAPTETEPTQETTAGA